MDRSLPNTFNLKTTLRTLQQSPGNTDFYFYTFFCPCKTEQRGFGDRL